MARIAALCSRLTHCPFLVMCQAADQDSVRNQMIWERLNNPIYLPPREIRQPLAHAIDEAYAIFSP